tara:strand:- start:1374 stop:4844 length:3471 start_codon:yes stop_codon:yes gene_type:complete
MNKRSQISLINSQNWDTASDSIKFGQLYGSSIGLALAENRMQTEVSSLVICPNSEKAKIIADEISYFNQTDQVVEVFPDLEILPYDLSPPRRDIISKRSEILHKLIKKEVNLLVLNASSLLWKLPPRDFFDSLSQQIEVGQSLSINKIKEILKRSGFDRVAVVHDPGQYTVRGSIVDLYSPSEIHPIRIDLDDDHIDSIRLFDSASQLTIKQIKSTWIIPANQFPRDSKAIDLFKANMRNHFEGNQMEWPLYNYIYDDPENHGVYNYLPLFYNTMSSILDFIDRSTRIFLIDDFSSSLLGFKHLIDQRFNDYQLDTQPIMQPNELFFNAKKIINEINQKTPFTIQSEKFTSTNKQQVINFDTQPLLLETSDISLIIDKILLLIEKESVSKVLISAPTKKKQSLIKNYFKSTSLSIDMAKNWTDFLTQKDGIYLTEKILGKGFLIKSQGLAVIGEIDLFGKLTKKINKTYRKQDPETIIENLKDLQKGALVVHRDYGIGKYDGLKRLLVDEIESEFLCINYAKGDLLQLPITQMEKVSRYIGDSSDESLLSNLGNNQWRKICKKAKAKAQDMAAELLEMYANRKLTPGNSQPINQQDYDVFCRGFQFILTGDQAKVIDQVLDDMGSSRKMDRLVCGDVGFGKTEVALRAAFSSVMNGNQVVLMVPTTLLAQQHYETFQERFTDWPVNIELLSRTQTLKKRDEIFETLRLGQTDIVIGTHAVLSERISYPKLGLVIVDEEHRFGVKDKERLKKIRYDVDYLAMTATPIPRTLNMAIGELKDISMIATPPESRLPIRTYISRWDRNLIKEAFQREINRGGQILFVHNKIADIENISEELKNIFPDLSIEIAHGQMKEKRLEQIMMRFYNNKFSVLLATTIIESGLDIPNANTIIINHANRFGLAQLHQLRGRVGRSERQSYAYLLTPPKNQITEDGLKRLEAIEAIEDLGVGFILAMHDLEIRGAGEILGDEQSGQIQKIGFTLYKDLLSEAVNSLKDFGTSDDPFSSTDINLNLPTLIPEDYMPDVHLRLIFYKRIASTDNDSQIKEIKHELIDRFGALPEFTSNLLEVTKLKNKANLIGIERIKLNNQYGRIYFHSSTPIESDLLIQLIKDNHDKFRLYPDQSLGFKGDFQVSIDKIKEIQGLLKHLTSGQAPQSTH